MKDFELRTLIFNENEKFRTFNSSDFNFVLDKENKFSICYGTVLQETPTYDPLSPEEFDLIIDNNFVFSNNVQNINKIFNIKNDKKELIMMSTASTVNFIINSIYDDNIEEVNKLNNYLDQFGIFINLVISYNEINELRDVTRLKLFNIKNIIINVENFDYNNLLNQVNLILSKDILVSYNFLISKKNVNDFEKLILNGFPGNTFSKIIFKDKTSKTIRKNVAELLKNKGNFLICNTKNVNNDEIDFPNILKNVDGLFKCYVNMIDENVSYEKNGENIKFNEIERINSYWNSDLFNNYRKNLNLNKYEDLKEK